MAADFSIKAHDRLPVIRATLSADLSAATGVDFIMRPKAGGPTKVNAAAAVVDAPNGVVEYLWLAADTDTPGEYQAEWEVEWSAGIRQTFPTTSYHSIDVLADLDDE